MTVVALEGFIFVVLPSVGLRKLVEMRMSVLDFSLLPPRFSLLLKAVEIASNETSGATG